MCRRSLQVSDYFAVLCTMTVAAVLLIGLVNSIFVPLLPLETRRGYSGPLPGSMQDRRGEKLLPGPCLMLQTLCLSRRSMGLIISDLLMFARDCSSHVHYGTFAASGNAGGVYLHAKLELLKSISAIVFQPLWECRMCKMIFDACDGSFVVLAVHSSPL